MWASTMEVFRVQAQKKLHEAVSCWEAEPMGKFWAARWVGDGKVINGRNQLNSKKWYDNWVVATQIFFLIFTPKIGEDEPILTSIFFTGGWFNHQLRIRDFLFSRWDDYCSIMTDVGSMDLPEKDAIVNHEDGIPTPSKPSSTSHDCILEPRGDARGWFFFFHTKNKVKSWCLEGEFLRQSYPHPFPAPAKK